AIGRGPMNRTRRILLEQYPDVDIAPLARRSPPLASEQVDGRRAVRIAREELPQRLLDRGCLHLHLRRDQSQVVVAALVDHGDLLGVEVAEDDELVLRVLEAQRGLLDRHRTDGKVVRLDDAGAIVVAALWQAAGLA